MAHNCVHMLRKPGGGCFKSIVLFYTIRNWLTKWSRWGLGKGLQATVQVIVQLVLIRQDI